jgi:hypothetical protein
MSRASRWIVFVFLFVVLCSLLVVPWLLSASPGSPALAAGDPVIAVAGDIACDPANSVFNSGNGNSNACRQKYTSDLLVNAGLAAVLALGDVQYFCGGYQAFVQSYDLSWGRVKSITRPAVGNHEYLTSGGTDCNSANAGAAGYFRYYGAAAGKPGQGYYSFDIGSWHLIALNSNCSDVGGCAPGTPQGDWLNADLAAHANFCTLAFWHIPLFSSGGRAAANSRTFWQALYDNNADLILNGHDHIYERFAPQTPTGALDTVRGIREFIVGTGGSDHTTITGVAANSQLRNADSYGVMKLTLHPDSYEWQFVPEVGGSFRDAGSQACHGASGATATPTSVPPTPTLSPTTAAPTATAAATNTPTNVPPSATATYTATAVPHVTATETATAVPIATATDTATALPGSTATDTATAVAAAATSTNTPAAPSLTSTAPAGLTHTPAAVPPVATVPASNATAITTAPYPAPPLTATSTPVLAAQALTPAATAPSAIASGTNAAATPAIVTQANPQPTARGGAPADGLTAASSMILWLALPLAAIALFLAWSWRRRVSGRQ